MVDADASESQNQVPEPKTPAAGSPTSVKDDPQPVYAHRPLIKFIGKRSRVTHSKPDGLSVSQGESESHPAHQVYDFPTFGRPTLSESEIDAINSGGSSLV